MMGVCWALEIQKLVAILGSEMVPHSDGHFCHKQGHQNHKIIGAFFILLVTTSIIIISSSSSSTGSVVIIIVDIVKVLPCRHHSPVGQSVVVVVLVSLPVSLGSVDCWPGRRVQHISNEVKEDDKNKNFEKPDVTQ